MKTNVGSIDRLIRVIVGLGILGLGAYFNNWWGLIGVLPILTAIAGYCPLYVPFHINTHKPKLPTG